MKSFEQSFEFAKILSEFTDELNFSARETTSTIDPSGLSYLLGHLEQQRFQSFSTSSYVKYKTEKPKVKTIESECPYIWSTTENEAFQWLNSLLFPVDQLKGAFKIEGLKKAFKKAALKTHPDLGGSHESFLKLQQVHEILVTYLQKIV